MTTIDNHIPHASVGRTAKLFCSALCIALTATSVSAQSVWELTPYRIHLVVAVQAAAGLGPAWQSDLQQGLLARCASTASWEVSPGQASPRLRNRMCDHLASVSPDLLPKNRDDFDKIMLLVVNRCHDGYRISAREFDVRTQVFGPVVELPVAQQCKLRDTAFEALEQAFAPIARVAASKGAKVTLRLRAGNLPTHDQSPNALKPGDVLRPFVRYLDRQGKPRRVVEVPWTFLVVEEIQPRSFKCKLHSALNGPLSGRRRGRVEQLALAVRPQGKSTQLAFSDRVEPHRPLCGYDVLAQPPAAKTAATLLGRSDGRGTVEIASTAASPLRILIVKCGTSVIARLPIVPGLHERLEAELPGIDQYLQIEGFISSIQNEMIDLLTRREVLIARARKHLDNNELDQAAAVLHELRSLRTRTELLRILDRRQEKTVVDDKWSKKKIDALFSDTRKLLDRFLDPAKIEKIARQIAAAREKRSDQDPFAD